MNTVIYYVHKRRDKMLAKKNLIVTKCPKCGETIVTFTDSLTIKCRCGEVIVYRPMELKNGYYVCPNCGKSVYFRALGEIAEIRCNGCGSWIDLVWHKKHHKYVSL